MQQKCFIFYCGNILIPSFINALLLYYLRKSYWDCRGRKLILHYLPAHSTLMTIPLYQIGVRAEKVKYINICLQCRKTIGVRTVCVSERDWLVSSNSPANLSTQIPVHDQPGNHVLCPPSY